MCQPGGSASPVASSGPVAPEGQAQEVGRRGGDDVGGDDAPSDMGLQAIEVECGLGHGATVARRSIIGLVAIFASVFAFIWVMKS